MRQCGSSVYALIWVTHSVTPSSELHSPSRGRISLGSVLSEDVPRMLAQSCNSILLVFRCRSHPSGAFAGNHGANPKCGNQFRQPFWLVRHVRGRCQRWKAQGSEPECANEGVATTLQTCGSSVKCNLSLTKIRLNCQEEKGDGKTTRGLKPLRLKVRLI
jgi:hypothetical protein